MILPHRLFAGMAALVLFVGTVFCQKSFSISRQDTKMVPITTYAPAKDTCRGVAIISPGAGVSEKGYSYLGDAMSSLGYFTIVVGHQESGRQALRRQIRDHGLREGPAKLITDPEAYKGRFMDIAAAKRWAIARCNTIESILIGHSMGAATVMIEAGAKNKLGLRGSNAFDVYVALSPQGVGSIFPSDAWRGISKPVLSITGTRDEGLGSPSWKTQLEPFNNMSPGCKWQGVIEGATHLSFAGNGMSRRTEALTVKTIQAFLIRLHNRDCSPPQRESGIEIQAK